MICKSSNTASPWHHFESDLTWKAWGGACENTPCTYSNDPAKKNVYPAMTADMATWMANDFDDSAWRDAEQGAHYGQIAGSKIAICNSDGPGWLFRSPDLSNFKGPATWTRVYGQGSVTGPTTSAADFNAQIQAAGAGAAPVIMRRICSGCSADYQEIYYVRRTEKTTFDYYARLLQTWDDDGFHTAFDIYSNFADAEQETNPWLFCNSAVKVNHQGVAFPRDCGITRFVGGQWNGLSGGQRNYAFELLSSGR
jgi:hypothetical protein